MKKLSKSINENQIVKAIVSNSNLGIWNGKDATEYFFSCRYWLEKYEALVIFSRDEGHHTSGWWKNPYYERCYHLSISFVDKFGNNKPHNTKKANKIVKMLFGTNSRLIWCEPPYSEDGIKKDVWHYRLFCDINWKAIKPRGEVYSKEFTEVGWKSFSEIQKLNSIHY